MSKKTAAKPKDEATYEVRDIVLAKIRGYPMWPGQVVDPETSPPAVLKERPMGKKQAFYCVRFFPAGDYAWVVSKDLSLLKKHEIEAYINEPHKKNGDLLNGYKIALDPTDWEKEQANKQAAVDEETANAEVDELEDDEEEGGDDSEKPKTKKRKRDPEAANKKTKKDAAAPAKKAKKAEKDEKPTKARKSGAKSKKLVESEDEGGERGGDAGPSKKATPPPTKKAKRDKEDGPEDALEKELNNDPEAVKVKDWRHKIQRALLSKVPPKDLDINVVDAIFTQVEEYEMPLNYLKYTKFGKVMKHITAKADGEVPRNDEFKFKDRAQALVNKWHTLGGLNASGEVNGIKPGDSEHKENGIINGDAVPPTTSTAAVEEQVKEDKEMKDINAGDLTMESAVADVTMSETA